MRAICYLTILGAIYLLAAFTLPDKWLAVVQLLWLFLTSLPLWFRPLELWVFQR